jgi:hypothetical protein
MHVERGTNLQASWVLRIGVAMEFIGHGALGLRHTSAWTSYFAVIGIPRDTALAMMPIVGGLDVALGIALLLYPARGVLLYMAFWGLCTSLVRPLAGESSWEAVERAGNFGSALALFLMAEGQGARSWLRFAGFDAAETALRGRVCWVLRLTTAGLLLGHGALGLLVHKPLLGSQYAAIGLPGTWIERRVGAFECALALAVLLRPGFGLLVFVLAWKLATEALSPIAGSPVWVFIEHGGSYAAPLALAIMLRGRREESSVPLRASPT